MEDARRERGVRPGAAEHLREVFGGAGAAGWAIGSQPCKGGSPAFDPAPASNSSSITAPAAPSGGWARQAAKSPPSPNPTAIAARTHSALMIAMVM